MNRPIVLSLAILLAPAAAFAQDAPPPPAAGAEPGGPADAGTPSPQQRAAMQQMHAQLEQARLQTRARMLAALTPAHRTAVATVVGQLVTSVNPNPQAAAASLDAILAPVEKQSIVNIAAAERANVRAFMSQQRALFESTLSANQKAAMAQREAKRQAFMQSHPRPARVADPGEIVLRTLSSVGGGPGMHGRPF